MAKKTVQTEVVPGAGVSKFVDGATGLTTSVSVVNIGQAIDATGFALISEPGALEALKWNLQSEQISEFDLDRIKVPAGGGLMWQVQTLDGIQSVPTIDGVLLSSQVRKGYWESLTLSNSPPDCYSLDGIRGVGNPGGECSACPFNEFGSAVKQDMSQGRGKRCKERRMLLIQRPTDRLPIAVFAPAGSIKAIKQFLMRLPVAGYRAVVSLGLAQDKNEDGILYSKIVPRYLGHISEEAGRSMLDWVKTLNDSLGKSITAEDFEEPQGESA